MTTAPAATPVIPFTRMVFVLGVCLTLGTGIALFAAPADTASYWAWTIKAPLTAAFFGTILWGVGLGVHESVMAAAVAQIVPTGRVASAYGLFNLGFGIAWFVGSAVMGVLYDISIPALVAFSIVAELAAIPIFLRLRRNPALSGDGAST